MDARTRLEAALAIDVADRPPAGAWGHAFMAEWSPKALSDVTAAAQRRFGWDFVKFQPRATCFAEAFGARFRPSGHPMRGPVSMGVTIEELGGWPSLRKSGASSPPLADQVASIGMVASRLGPSVPVIQTVFSPLTIAGFLMGRNPRRIVAELQDRPEVLRKALDRIADALIDFAARSIEAGASGIFFAISGYATEKVMPIDVYKSLVLVHDQKVLDSLPPAAWFNVLHLCGSGVHFDLLDTLPTAAVNWSVYDRGNPSLREGIERTGRAAMGGVAQRSTLIKGPPESIAAQVRRAVRVNGGRGVIVAPGCSVPPRAPAEHLKVISQTAAEEVKS